MDQDRNNQEQGKNTGSNQDTSKSAVTGSAPIENDNSSPDNNDKPESPRNQDSNDLRSGRSDQSNKDMGQP